MIRLTNYSEGNIESDYSIAIFSKVLYIPWNNLSLLGGVYVDHTLLYPLWKRRLLVLERRTDLNIAQLFQKRIHTFEIGACEFSILKFPQLPALGGLS